MGVDQAASLDQCEKTFVIGQYIYLCSVLERHVAFCSCCARAYACTVCTVWVGGGGALVTMRLGLAVPLPVLLVLLFSRRDHGNDVLLLPAADPDASFAFGSNISAAVEENVFQPLIMMLCSGRSARLPHLHSIISLCSLMRQNDRMQKRV